MIIIDINYYLQRYITIELKGNSDLMQGDLVRGEFVHTINSTIYK